MALVKIFFGSLERPLAIIDYYGVLRKSSGICEP